MSATSVGAVIGGAIDGMSGDDSVVDGAITGAILANVLKVAVPLAIIGTAAWMAWRGARDIIDTVTGEKDEQAA